MGPKAATTCGGGTPSLPDLFADRRHDRVTTGKPLELARFGYRWLRLPG